jgi:hypothetical protein
LNNNFDFSDSILVLLPAANMIVVNDTLGLLAKTISYPSAF